MRACTCGNIDVVYLLIKAGSNIIHANHNGWTALLVAYRNNQERIATMLIASGASIMMSSLFSACASGDLTLTKVITARGIDINDIRNDGLTPLMVACKLHQYSVVDFLVNEKACFNNDITVMNLFCEEYDNEGFNVLTRLVKMDIHYPSSY
ncbi:unnamed protein product [Mytilus edulis]|uniref:Uncharacterized protein n=1 Tax=Mytilus edulis TaxID=6550 RepID=A0A8S3VR15_MYTED|nr:unnamed protein product [Mytilus edulis]